MTTPQPQPQQQPPPSAADEHFSPEKAAEAIADLDAKEKATLRKLARSYWEDRMSGPNAEADPDDLLQEAIVRTLQGTRRWRRSVTIIKHLVRTMQSISWEAHRARSAQPHAWAEDGVEEIDPGDRPADSDESVVEDVVLAREELAQVESLFEHDQEALRVLRCRSIELSPSETCEELGMERSRYDTVNKRIWRKLTKSAKNTQPEEGQ
jgi:DNA-directed RNA polymerase specialized sigma24 family protein